LEKVSICRFIKICKNDDENYKIQDQLLSTHSFTSKDVNELTKTGFYYLWNGCTNVPAGYGSGSYLIVLHSTDGIITFVQLLFGSIPSAMKNYKRYFTSSIWGEWYEI
jgi:hypothetical protein